MDDGPKRGQQWENTGILNLKPILAGGTSNGRFMSRGLCRRTWGIALPLSFLAALDSPALPRWQPSNFVVIRRSALRGVYGC